MNSMRKNRKSQTRPSENKLLEELKTPMSYEDLEGLVVNLGVIAALMLSVVLGMFFAFSPEEWDNADARNCASLSKVFRDVVVHTLDLQGFNFTVDFGAGHVLHLKDQEWSCDNTNYDPMQTGTAACSLFLSQFPMSVFRAWQLTPSGTKECGLLVQGGLRAGTSFQMLTTGGWASAFYSAALSTSIIIYMSLALSDVREEASDPDASLIATGYWMRIMTPLVWINYAFMIVGTVQFFRFVADGVCAKYPNASFSRYMAIFPMFCFFTPIMVISLVIGVVATLLGKRDGFCLRHKELHYKQKQSQQVESQANN